jgi:hypothetical protein
MPEKGVFLDASIIAERWFQPFGSALSLDCGRFWIDTVDFALPAHKVTIKASSIPTDTRIKGSTETRGWDDTTLNDIATQIAGENKMSVDWQADNNPRYHRVEQTGESGLAFLLARAKDAKLSIKVHRQKIVFFDEEKLEAAAPKFELLYGDTAASGGLASYRMSGGDLQTKLTDTTKGAKVKNADADSGKVDEGGFNATDQDLMEENVDQVHVDPETEDTNPGGNGGQRTEGLVDDWTQTDAGSDLKAKAHVRDKNKDKFNGHIDLSIGNPLIAAGQTFNLKGVGQYDGKWFIVSAHHTVGPEYKTVLEVRKCLQGY